MSSLLISAIVGEASFGLGNTDLLCWQSSARSAAVHAALWVQWTLAGGDCATEWLRVNLFHVLGLLGLVGTITRLALLREDSFLPAGGGREN